MVIAMDVDCIIYIWYMDKNILADEKFTTKFTAPKFSA
jgi:hypothetical protein